MSVPAWKWLLTALDEELLIAIAKSLKVRIPGFRGSNWEKSVKLLRPRLIQDMLLPRKLLLLYDAADTEVQKDPDLLALRELTEQQLLEQVPSQLAPAPVLLSLLSSPEESIAELGEVLYQAWETDGVLAQWQQAQEELVDAAKEQASDEQTELERCREQLAELEAQLKKRERKLQKLAASYAKQKTSVTRAQRRWQQERKQLAKQLAEQNVTLKERATQLAEQAQALSTQAETITQLKAAAAIHSEQEASCHPDKTDWEKQMPAENLPQCEPGASQLASELQTIAIVGTLQRVNMPPQEHAGYRLLHVSPMDIKNEQASQILQAADQVWLLTYATPLPMQRWLRQLVPQDNLFCFATYQEYMNNLGQGV